MRNCFPILFQSPLPALVLSGCVLQGCLQVGPDYQAPVDQIPDAWTRSVAGHLEGRQPEIESWWTKFNDSTLNTLMDRTREANKDLKVALQRIYEARAQRGIAKSKLFPSAGASGDYARNRASESLFVVPSENPANLFSAGFDANWEIDVFGGTRRNVEATDALIGSSIENSRDVLVSLLAEVAVNYIEFRTLQERIVIANKNISIQESSRDKAKARFDAELDPELDVTQAETNLELTRSVLPTLRTQLTLARNRLATLTGGFPGSLDGVLSRGGGIPTASRRMAVGLPVDLLRSRPDVRRAEREFAAQSALIGVAAADLYPRFQLFGNFDLQSIKSSDFFGSASRAYSFGPSFSWKIFSAGAIRSNIKVAESRAEQALLNYEGTVLKAVEEVEASMVSITNEGDRLNTLGKAAKNASRALEIVQAGEDEDLFDYQRVIDSLRTKFEVEDSVAVSRGKIASDQVALYKALGGGTSVEVLPVEEPSMTTSGLLRKNTKGRSNGATEEPGVVPESGKGISK